ncbi:Gx transporter family protein [Clostridium saccharobutylicum]|nr:Gx transporter family protein [Clostridium saccharobutylicum]AQR88861.1 heptaprenyl diphosphate synthase component I [Clostridium saccharobutylicum]AQR98760.1 heptaprenyl diphosphate synthase component I [Clostridium saccharobutylicum]AQS08482.1 heptaprenyl diphosphate synthase component I [Clostridium saccharobutylicum]AQS12750.1 heptaprenyl diphosphate synthase component I [Clostridium saccharobutylicum]MBA2904140.1 heptaprenyl diphosphate synthase [Clostridium saccharobutylicum]
MKKTFRIVFIGLLVSQALALYTIESMIPVPFIAPGAKLGLTNLITVIALYILNNKKDVFLIILLRLLLSTIFNGSLSTFMYGAAGAILSYYVMIFVKKFGKDRVSIVGVSCSGAVFHNIGQLVVASAIVQNIAVMLYLPILSIAGIGTGIFIGVTANFVVKHLSKLPYFKSLNLDL